MRKCCDSDMFCAHQYTTGTILICSNGTILTGTGMNWLNSLRATTGMVKGNGFKTVDS